MSLQELIPWHWGPARAVSRRGEADPFTALQREMNRAFDRFFEGDDFFGGPLLRESVGGVLSPKVDVSETDKEVHVAVELPGLTEQDINVELADNALKIHGEKKDERETKEHNFHRTERVFGMFERVIPLPAKVQRDGVNATFKNGVLSVVLPKQAPTAVHQKINVTRAS